MYTLLLPRHGGPLLGPALLPGAEADSAPHLQSVVLHSGVVGIEELFEPLRGRGNFKMKSVNQQLHYRNEPVKYDLNLCLSDERTY